MSHREGWEQTRLVVNSYCKIMTGESAEITLPYDETDAPEDTEEDLEELRELVRKEQAILDAKK